MKVIFVRHGHYDKVVGAASGNNQVPLSALGERGAKAAGEFLRPLSLLPDIVWVTKRERTRQTARIVLGELGVEGIKIEEDGGGPKSGGKTLDAKLHAWLAGRTAEVLMFVGHGTSQRYLAKLGGVLNPRDGYKAAVLVLEQHHGGWRCTDRFEGTAE